jgi:polar amino acid transport system substrate-binding protein
VFSFSSADLYIALSKGTATDVAAAWQRALDGMKKDGTVAAIGRRWLPSDSLPTWVISPSPFGYPRPVVRLYTEDAPPGNYLKDGKVQGFSVALIREIFRRLALKENITLVPWARAYEMAQTDPVTGVFSTTRLTQRESMFKWVGPLYHQKWGLYGRKGREVVISNLGDARSVQRIGTYLKDAKETYLKGLGFTNLVSANKNQVNIVHLNDGRIDLWASSDFNMPYLVKQAGLSPDLFQNYFTFHEVANYIAFHRGMPDPVVAAWQRVLDDIKSEGLYERLYNTLIRFEEPRED